ncbi:MAG: PEP-utilizing enzyme [Candidatus Woesearchaeota archaeon]
MKTDYVKKYTWFRQGADVSLFFANKPFKNCFILFGKESFFGFSKGLHSKLCFAMELLKPIAQKKLMLHELGKETINDYFLNWKKYHDEKMNLINKTKLNELNKEQLIEVLKKFSEIDENLWIYSLYPELFDAFDHDLLNERLANNNINLDENEFKDLVNPLSPTLIRVSNEMHLLSKQIGEEKASEMMAEKYHYLHNDWANVTKLNKDFFLDLKPNLNYEQNLINRKLEIEKKYNFDIKLKNSFTFFRTLSDLRELRKEDIQMSNAFLTEYLENVKKYTKLSVHEMKFLLHSELIDLLNGKKLNFKDRLNQFVMVYEEDILTNKDAEIGIKDFNERFKNQFNEIKGRTAMIGKAKGYAKILLGRADFNKMNNNDILVAPSTRPEYLPVMKKASAIITDEGGLTSHAAIVSRELKIPCIIGTQIATELINDNDLVEVDADNGIVRKVS